MLYCKLIALSHNHPLTDTSLLQTAFDFLQRDILHPPSETHTMRSVAPNLVCESLYSPTGYSLILRPPVIIPNQENIGVIARYNPTKNSIRTQIGRFQPISSSECGFRTRLIIDKPFVASDAPVPVSIYSVPNNVQVTGHQIGRQPSLLLFGKGTWEGEHDSYETILSGTWTNHTGRAPHPAVVGTWIPQQMQTSEGVSTITWQHLSGQHSKWIELVDNRHRTEVTGTLRYRYGHMEMRGATTIHYITDNKLQTELFMEKVVSSSPKGFAHFFSPVGIETALKVEGTWAPDPSCSELRNVRCVGFFSAEQCSIYKQHTPLLNGYGTVITPQGAITGSWKNNVLESRLSYRPDDTKICQGIASRWGITGKFLGFVDGPGSVTLDSQTSHQVINGEWKNNVLYSTAPIVLSSGPTLFCDSAWSAEGKLLSVGSAGALMFPDGMRITGHRTSLQGDFIKLSGQGSIYVENSLFKAHALFLTQHGYRLGGNGSITFPNNTTIYGNFKFDPQTGIQTFREARTDTIYRLDFNR